MANTFSSLHLHLVFSTKNRERWVTADIEERIWTFMGGIARKNKMNAIQIGGVEDHVHVLLASPPTMAPAAAAKLIKGGSSAWVHATFAKLRGFGWQDGYGAFSVSKSNVPEVVAYIKNQREHHRRRTFKQEFLAMLKRHEVEYDERYIFD